MASSTLNMCSRSPCCSRAQAPAPVATPRLASCRHAHRRASKRIGPAPIPVASTTAADIHTASFMASAAAVPAQLQHLGSTASPTTSSSPSIESRCMGAMLGAMCGNVLGAPVQHDRHWLVTRRFPQGITNFWRFDTSPEPTSYGHYTGDFSLLLATAQGLLEAGFSDPTILAAALLQAPLVEEGQQQGQQQQIRRPGQETVAGEMEGRRQRRLSPFSKVLLTALATSNLPLPSIPHLAQKFLDENTSRNSQISGDRFEREPYGPADNGAAARILPLALAYRDASPEALERAVQQACLFSHPHPAGSDGARVAAAAISWLCHHQVSSQAADSSSSSRGRGGEEAGPRELLQHLSSVAQTEDMRAKLDLLQQQLFQLEHVTSWRDFYRGPQWLRLSEQLTRLTFHGYATLGTEAVAVALLALLTSWGRPEQAMVVAASFGGSAPVTTQLTGAMAGALYGDAWLPARWLSDLENGPEGGRDTVAALARQLAAMRCGSDQASQN